MKHNKVISLILLVFIAFWAYLTIGLPEGTMPGEPGPKFFPSVLLALMAIFSVVLFFIKDKEKPAPQEFVMEDGEKIEVKADETFPLKSAFTLFGVFLAGIILIYFIGFNLGMIIASSVMLWMIGWKLFPRAIVFSAAVTLVVYLLFDKVMRIPLPTGMLF